MVRGDGMFLRMIKKILTDPKTIILGVVSGFLFGFYFPEQAHVLEPFGRLYVALLSMCVLPIMVSALTWGIGQMLRDPRTRVLFPRMATLYGLGLLLPCVVGLAVALVAQPGAELGKKSASLLGSQMMSMERSREPGGVMEFLTQMIPPNVFDALSKGQFISIVFFCMLLGLALGVVRSKGADETLRVVNTLYETFSLIFHWVLVPLPIGLFALVAANMAEADRELLKAMVTYVGFFYLAAAILFLLYIVILSIVSAKPPWRLIAELKTPLILAFATDNPFVALYSAIEVLRSKFNVSREIADTLVPFGVVANQHGQILLFAFTIPFLAQVYGIELSGISLVIIGLGVILSGAAAVGGGPVLAPIMAPILLGAGIPDALAVVILATTQAAIAPAGSVLTVQATCTLAVLTAVSKKTGDVAAPEVTTAAAGTAE